LRKASLIGGYSLNRFQQVAGRIADALAVHAKVRIETPGIFHHSFQVGAGETVRRIEDSIDVL